MIVTFILIYWLQTFEKEFNKKNKFDRFKLPILAMSLVGLLSSFIFENKDQSNINNVISCQEIFTEVARF